MFMKRGFAPACSGLYESVGLLHGGSRVKISLVVKKKLLSGFCGLLLSLIKDYALGCKRIPELRQKAPSMTSWSKSTAEDGQGP